MRTHPPTHTHTGGQAGRQAGRQKHPNDPTLPGENTTTKQTTHPTVFCDQCMWMCACVGAHACACETSKLQLQISGPLAKCWLIFVAFPCYWRLLLMPIKIFFELTWEYSVYFMMFTVLTDCVFFHGGHMCLCKHVYQCISKYPQVYQQPFFWCLRPN